MTWIHPLLSQSVNLKKLNDTIELEMPKVTRFYPDMAKLNDGTKDVHGLHRVKYNEIPTTADIREVLRPYFIKNFEVTNGEYKEFLSHQTEENKALLYPDTLVWITDFKYAYNDPLTKMYFYHPKYDMYPVVGVNYYQAQAYCLWYQEKLNEELKLEGKRIIVDLPNQFEWAFANGDVYYGGTQRRPSYLSGFYDTDYLTNLNLIHDTTHQNLINRAILPGYANMNTQNFMSDGYLYTSSIAHKKQVWGPVTVHMDQVAGVYYMNTNVSEWCKETYQDNWKELFAWRQNQLRSMGTKESLLLADLEAYYNDFNDTVSGQMVRGGNWLYEHHSFRNGQNVGMHDAKLFINPNKGHSTVGFRYVIRFEDVVESASK